MLYFDEFDDLLEYYLANAEHYNGILFQDYKDEPDPCWMCTGILMKEINLRFLSLCLNRGLFTGTMDTNILEIDNIPETAYQIYDIGFGENLVIRYYCPEKSRVENEYYLVPKPYKGRPARPWRGWVPNNRIIPDGITII